MPCASIAHEHLARDDRARQRPFSSAALSRRSPGSATRTRERPPHRFPSVAQGAT
jgi:hypothetical protein